MTTTKEKIAHERLQMHYKSQFLNNIESVNEELESLKTNHKDVESKEIEIHYLWKKYEEI